MPEWDIGPAIQNLFVAFGVLTFTASELEAFIAYTAVCYVLDSIACEGGPASVDLPHMPVDRAFGRRGAARVQSPVLAALLSQQGR